MDAENLAITVWSKHGQHLKATVTLTNGTSDCTVVLKIEDRTFKATDRDYFEALCRIREEMEPLGLRPLCYGASRNVLPSGLARDMGGAIKAYKLTLGKHGKLSDIVGIFDTGDDVEPVTVAEQQAFYTPSHLLA